MCDHHSSDLDGGHRATTMTRRTAVGAAGAGGVALLFAGIKGGPAGAIVEAFGPDVAEAASGSCTMTAAKTVGPYFVDEKLNRSDVRANTSDGAVQAGVPFVLTLQIFDADNSCAPVSGATVDIWHCNAYGLYSDEAANNTSGQNWLRGYQTSDADGLVSFTTIYPGWYSGRCPHIHFKVRVYNGSTETLEFTSQLFFTDAFSSSLYTNNAPYNTRSQKTPDTTDSKDNIYESSLVLTPTSSGSGYAAQFSVGVSKTTSQLNNNSAGGAGGGGMPPGGAPTGKGGPTGAGGTSSGSGSGSGSTGSGSTTTTSGAAAVSAALKAATMIRTALGTRQLRLKITTTEAITVTAKLKRGSTTIASKKTRLSTGTKYVRVTIPSTRKAGAAKLALTLTDGDGNVKSYTRTVNVRSA